MTTPARPPRPRRLSASADKTADSYILLFDVQFRHAYYNANDKQCPDFQAVPAPGCAALMASLGLLCRVGEYGFAIYLRSSRLPALASYLASHAGTAPPGQGIWTALSFQLLPRNAGFVGITDLPVTTNPLDENLFVTNLATAGAGGQLVFAAPDGSAGARWLPVATSQLTVPTTPGYTAVLTALSGGAVPAASTAAQSATTFNLAGLPGGCYTVGFAAADGSVSTAQPAGYRGRARWWSFRRGRSRWDLSRWCWHNRRRGPAIQRRFRSR